MRPRPPRAETPERDDLCLWRAGFAERAVQVLFEQQRLSKSTAASTARPESTAVEAHTGSIPAMAIDDSNARWWWE